MFSGNFKIRLSRFNPKKMSPKLQSLDLLLIKIFFSARKRLFGGKLKKLARNFEIRDKFSPPKRKTFHLKVSK